MTAKRKPHPRSSAAERIARVDAVLELICNGATRTDIQRFAKEKTTWGVHKRLVDAYIAEATQALRESSEVDREAERAKAYRRLENLYARALRVQDYKVCLSVQKELCRFLGLEEQNKADLERGRVETLMAELRRIEADNKGWAPPKNGIAIMEPPPAELENQDNATEAV